MNDRPKPDHGPADLRVHAYSLAYLFATGATLLVITVGFYQPDGQDTLGLLGIATAAYVAALVLRFAHRWLPEWAYPAFVFVGTFLITFGIQFSGEGSSAYALFYLWVCIYSFYFFSRAMAIAQLATLGIAYAIVLEVGPDSSAPGARWLLDDRHAVGRGLAGGQSGGDGPRAGGRGGGPRRAAAPERGARPGHHRDANDGLRRHRRARPAITDWNPAAERDVRAGHSTGARHAAERHPRSGALSAASWHGRVSKVLRTAEDPMMDRPARPQGCIATAASSPVELAVSPLAQDGRTTGFNASSTTSPSASRGAADSRPGRGSWPAWRKWPATSPCDRRLRRAPGDLHRRAGSRRGRSVDPREPDPKGQRARCPTPIVGVQVASVRPCLHRRPLGRGDGFLVRQPHFVADLPATRRLAAPGPRRARVASALWQPVSGTASRSAS